jgi:hypothetical protein
MSNTIQIKRSQVTATPPALAPGELAYSEQSRTLFIGLQNATVLAIGLFALKTYVDQKISSIIGGAPALLDTLKEFSDALGGDANFAATTATQIGLRLLASANLSDLPDKAAARLALQLGSLALQAANAVNITGGTISGVTLSNVTLPEVNVDGGTF